MPMIVKRSFLDSERLSDGVRQGKELLPNVVSNNADVVGVIDLVLGEEAPLDDGHALDVSHLRGRANDLGAKELFALMFEIGAVKLFGAHFFTALTGVSSQNAFQAIRSSCSA